MKNQPKLNTFKDTKGRIWDLTITAGTYLSLKDDDIDISSVFSGADNVLEEMIGGDRITVMLDVIAMITEEQRKQKDVSDKDFYESLDGEVIESATLAFLQAVVNFTPAPKQPAMLAVLSQVRKAMDHASQALTEKIQSEEVLDEITSLIDQQIVDL